MKYDMITMGSGVVDVFLETDLKEGKGYLCLPTGYKIIVDDLWFATGGGGTNTAVSFSRMGLKTGFIGKLGKDEHAHIILSELKRENVDFLGTQGEESTGYSVVIDGKQKNRTVLAFKGANEFLEFSDIRRNMETKWFYFASMIGKSFEAQKKIAKLAFDRDIKIAYNPSSYLTKLGVEYLRDILRRSEILILNKEEGQDLVGKYQGKELLGRLRKLGPKIVCVTDGENGNGVYDGSRFVFSKSNRIKVKERTGAGDAFASGFVSEFITSGDIDKSVRVGSVNAESVIQHYGAKVGLMRRKEIVRHLNRIKTYS